MRFMKVMHFKELKGIVIFSFLSLFCNAQDIHFSQFFAMPIFVNPANAGVEHDLDIGVIHRTQWKAVAQPFTSYGVSISGKASNNKKKNSLGLGLDSYYDKSGDASFVSLQAGITLAYKIRINELSSISSGIKINYNQRSINNTNFQWGEQYYGKSYNSTLPSGEQIINLQSINFIDVAAGFNYRYKKGDKNISSNDLRIIDVGVSGFHINSTNVALYKEASNGLGTRGVFYCQAHLGLRNTNMSLLPKVFYQIQGTHQELVLGMLASLKPKNESTVTGFVVSNVFNIGVLYRGKDAFIGVVQYEMKNYVIGLSYDINVSKMTSTTTGRGAYEITLRYVGVNEYLRRTLHRKYGPNKTF